VGSSDSFYLEAEVNGGVGVVGTTFEFSGVFDDVRVG
jgi:hypothetical protein